MFGGYDEETEEDREESRASAGKKKQTPQSVSIPLSLELSHNMERTDPF